ncbi:hypothetical protein F5Y19DRAFT_173592 [Xylariaceae sp. FL1651]|nr:hypothetical protein F5Y19DRAFT_173592 [Xylariaceae sp. FL1651]
MTALPILTDEPKRYPGCCLSLSLPLLNTISSLLDSISTPAVSHVDGNEDGPGLVLSIGSGTGLLEELLQTHLAHSTYSGCQTQDNGDFKPPRSFASAPSCPGSSGRSQIHHSFNVGWRVEGVEVKPSVNIHLPEDRINHVPGTWVVLEARACDATVLMFVYPRDGGLVRRYVEQFMASPKGSQASEGESGSRVGVYRRTKLVLWLGPKADWEDTGPGATSASNDIETLEMREGVGLAQYEMLAVLRPKLPRAKKPGET